MNHVREGWPAIVFVPALIFVLHDFEWLYGVDAYAFLAIGNMSAVPDAYERTHRPAGPAGAVVVLIDSRTHEERYHERSPLNRCALKQDLETIYSTRPKVVAIDLDISPALALNVDPNESLRQAKRDVPALAYELEFNCQKQIYELISKNAEAEDPIATVLLVPTRGTTEAVRQVQDEWKRRICAKRVMFGRADLPEQYGIVINQDENAGSFAKAVHYLLDEQTSHDPVPCEQTEPQKPQLRLISPRIYVDDIHAVTLESVTEKEKSGLNNVPLKSELTASPLFANTLRRALEPLDNKVVFFGAAYGTEDTFMTPVGQLYGVEIQAAAYLSQRAPVNQMRPLLAFSLDVLMAFVFSLLFSVSWGAYFRRRMSPHALDRQIACVFVVGLCVLFVGVVFITIVLSYFALRAGLWLSPVPIAVGMLIDAFALGSVHQAIEVATQQKFDAVERLQAAHKAHSFDKEAHRELKQHRRESRGIRESVYRFLVLDVARLLSSRQPTAAFALLVKRGIWIACVVYAFSLMFSH